MNKFDILKEINSIPSKILEANGSTYKGKTFAVVDICRIWSFYKTKRGAEGRIKRDSYVSYYDESTMDMHNCGFGKSVMEIKESEICNINDKGVWYRYIKDHWRHDWSYGNIAWEVKHSCDNEDTINFVIEMCEQLIKGEDFKIIKEYEYKEEPEQIEEVKEESPATEVTSELINNDNNKVKVNFNSELNGIEIIFRSKPSEEVREELKANGFNWSRFNKIWWAKDNKQRREFLINAGYLVLKEDNKEKTEEFETIVIEESKEIKELELKDYNALIDEDICQYNISKDLSNRVNNVAFFANDRDYNKDLKETLVSWKNKSLEVINMTDDIEMKDRIFNNAIRFNKKYYENKIKLLNHRANNPSWMVTGRSGLNVRKYNKACDRYNNIMLEANSIIEGFNDKLAHFKATIKKDKIQAINNRIDSFTKNNTNNLKFEKIKVKIKCSNTYNIFDNGTYDTIAYKYNNYYIIKNWGYWRIYNKEGNELNTTRTNTTLQAAKEYLTYIINNQVA